MNAGPIKQARAAWRAPAPLPRAEAVCQAGPVKGRGYCGLTKKAEQITDDWRKVTCPECQAARRADEEAKRDQR